MSGIYVHIPFCRQACNYCDFHFSTSLRGKEELVRAITTEAEIRRSYLDDLPLDSIYIGGGTPSLLSVEELTKIMESLSSFFSRKPNAEITLEANPDDISQPMLRNWKALGINRLSIGLQSFNDEELRWMNRAHNSAQSISSVKLAQDTGFSNISIDLIYGSRFQTLATWEKTLQTAVALEPTHVSAYNLTIEQKTALGHRYRRGTEPPVNDELSGQQFLAMIDYFNSQGLIQYEISNFGKAGFFAVHNSNYWLQKNYLGLGPSAHSYNGVSRQWNVKSNSAYVRALGSAMPYFEKEELSVNDRYNEYIMTRLRTIWGCKKEEIRVLFGDPVLSHFEEGLKRQMDWIILENGIVTLNKPGRLRADGIASDLFL